MNFYWLFNNSIFVILAINKLIFLAQQNQSGPLIKKSISETMFFNKMVCNRIYFVYSLHFLINNSPVVLEELCIFFGFEIF